MPTKTARDIVLATFTYLSEVTPPTQKVSDVRVEEIQPFDEGGKTFWRIILSYDNVGQFAFDRKREYKEFKVRDEDARVVYMKSPDAKQ